MSGRPESAPERPRRQAPVVAGTLYVVATPLGNLEDVTYRAVRVLGSVDLIAAEDTRRARVLLRHYGIATPTVSCFEGNEAARSGELVARLRGGASVAIISEAGMPGVSDPGHVLITRCLAGGVPVDVVPGPCAVSSALVVSGLPTEQFRFLGFLPRRGRPRKTLVASMVASPATTVLFESPRRLGRTLQELHDALGDRPAAVVRELTKVHQEVVRGSLGQLAVRFREEARGEMTVVVAPGEAWPMDEEALSKEVRARVRRGERPREIAAALAEVGGGKRHVYQLALGVSKNEPEVVDDP